jgi:H/ACA ribonucleoprotein complex subunit 1
MLLCLAFSSGPPERVVELGQFMHPCEASEVLCKSTIDKIPYFNAPVFLENIKQIGMCKF